MFLQRSKVRCLQVLSCFLLAGTLAACSLNSSPSSHPLSHAQPKVSPTAHQPGMPSFTPPTQCQPATPVANSPVGPEAHGRATHAQLWALIMASERIPVKVEAKQGVKIVWRMTGSGDFHIAAYSPSGGQIAPDWGPDEHGGSNWARPGDEWGVGFTFPTPGCWDIHVTRDNAAGDVWLDVK